MTAILPRQTDFHRFETGEALKRFFDRLFQCRDELSPVQCSVDGIGFFLREVLGDKDGDVKFVHLNHRLLLSLLQDGKGPHPLAVAQ